MPTQKKKWKRPDIHLSDLKRAATLNIGTILFGALFIYMVISIIMYLTAAHITPYQVTSGPLSKNQTYTALILRSEQLVQANTGGYATYYVRENSKVKKSGAVYGIGDGQTSGGTAELTEEDLTQIRSAMAKFAYNFDSNNFYDTYSFKYEMEGSLLQYAGLTDITEQDTDAEDIVAPTQTIGNQTVNFAPSDGIVQYTKDGYESVTADTIEPDHFNQKSYQKTNLRSSEQLSVGDDVYKLITSENWSLMIPLTDAQTVQLAGRETIRVKFLKDGVTQTGKFTIVTKDDHFYAKIDFSAGMLRYTSDRFIDIELVTNIKTGLKIPVSSIVNKDFYVIPKGYETTGGESDEIGFLKETTNKSGETSSEFVNATVYAQQEDLYYVDQEDFSDGDVIIKPESTERYTIGDTMPLEGVYCINKGYAVFRKVVIIDQNEEYCIVESGNTYGIAQFDNIVSDSSTVKEEEILY